MLSLIHIYIFFGPFPADGHNAAVIVLRRYFRPIFLRVPGTLCLHLYHNGRHDIQRGDVHLCGSGNIPRLVRCPDVVNAVVVCLGSAGAKAVQRRRLFLRGDRIAIDLFPGEEFSGRGGEQGEQGELLAGQFDTFSVADYQMSFPVCLLYTSGSFVRRRADPA